MTPNTFWKQLIAVILLLTGIYYVGCGIIFELAQYQDLFWISQSFFIVLAILSFYLGKYLVKQKNKNLFSQLIVIMMLNKLLFSVAIVVGYFKLKLPTDNLFLLPFFVVYIVHTIFEVSFLTKIGRE